MEISVVHRRSANLQFTKNRWQGHAFWLPADTLVASDFHDDFQCFGYTNKPVFYSTASADRSGSYRSNQIGPPSGHKSGHRACQHAISYSESRVTRCTHELALTAPFVKVENLFRHSFGDTNALFVLPAPPTARYNDLFPYIRSYLAFFTKWAQKRSQQ